MTPQEEVEYWKNEYEKLKRRIQVVTYRRVVSNLELESFPHADLAEIMTREFVAGVSKAASDYAVVDRQDGEDGIVTISATLMVVGAK